MSDKNRQLATRNIIGFLEHLLPGTGWSATYKEYLDKMTDKQFDDYINRLAKEEEFIIATNPVNSGFRLNKEHLNKVSEKIDAPFHHRIRMQDPETGQLYLTPVKHLVMCLTDRRQVQMFWKKNATAENSRKRNVLTGQPTGESKGSAISNPELNALKGRNLRNTMIELVKFRGGDTTAYAVGNNLIMRDGDVKLADLMYLPSKATVVYTQDAYFKAMHLRTNLLGK